jgi:hypothetical protein
LKGNLCKIKGLGVCHLAKSSWHASGTHVAHMAHTCTGGTTPLAQEKWHVVGQLG